MNERIKKLAEQATVFVADYDGQRWQIDPEKFAELIVKECADVITETRWHLPPTQQQIAVGIKEHFGVE
jgi:hypothetical protein